METKEVKIQDFPERKVVFATYVGNFIGNAEVYEGLFGKICGWAGSKGINLEGRQFLAAYYDDPNVTPVDQLTLDVCMEIEEAETVESDEVESKVLAGGKYVTVEVELESPAEYEDAWKFIVEWMITNNVEIDMTRPSYELYLNNPQEHPQGHHIVMICMCAK